ncbi:MAG: flagellar basal body-associated FliL family protein [Paracoccaceae bacterium]
MSEAAEIADTPPKKRSKLPLLLGLILALVLGSGGFYATYAGLILGDGHGAEAAHGDDIAALPDIAFVPVESVIVALGDGAQNRHLKFTAQIEVEQAHAADVTLLLPRIMDVFNSYLSAVDPVSLEESAAIVRVRAQLLRRVQIVVGEGRARDLLITEFVLN